MLVAAWDPLEQATPKAHLEDGAFIHALRTRSLFEIREESDCLCRYGEEKAEGKPKERQRERKRREATRKWPGQCSAQCVGAVCVWYCFVLCCVECVGVHEYLYIHPTAAVTHT